MASRRAIQRPQDRVSAEDLVSKRCDSSSGGNKQFRVDRLLKTVTGLDMEDLSMRIKRRQMATTKRSKGDDDCIAEVSQIRIYPMGQEYHVVVSW